MNLFHYPGVRPNFRPIEQLAQEPGFLRTSGVWHDSEEVNKVIQNTRMMGYDINPLDQPPAGYSATSLAYDLHGLVETQNPAGASKGWETALENANLIIARANLATQRAAVQPVIRLIGGLAAWGLREGTWSEEAISRLAPDKYGHIPLTRAISGSNGYDTKVVLRELTDEDIARTADREYFDPAILVRIGRFGAISAEFGMGENRVAFTTEERGGNLSVVLSQGERRQKTECRITEGESEPLRNHEGRGQMLMDITNAAENLVWGRRHEVRPLIAAMMKNRTLSPKPVTVPSPASRRRRWLFF